MIRKWIWRDVDIASYLRGSPHGYLCELAYSSVVLFSLVPSRMVTNAPLDMHEFAE